MSETASTTTKNSNERKWGRVLICGGTDWPKLGRKELKNSKQDQEPGPDLPTPHILRSLSNIKAVSVHTSHSGCHAIVLSLDGAAYLFGRNSSGGLGLPSSSHPFVSEMTPRKLRPMDLSAARNSSVKFVHAACGRSHSLLVTSDGQVYSAGANNLGQCGHSQAPEVSSFKLVNGPWSKGDPAIQVGAGVTFSLVLTESGKLYSFGSGEKGQLGNGRTGEHIATGNKTAFDVVTEPTLVRNLDGKKIVQIACGQQHSIILDSDGYVYVFGYNGYCRLGLGNQKDMLVPTLVPHFSGENPLTRGAKVAAGPTNSVVIDRQSMYHLAGKWKNSGEGSTGQPYTTFRYLADIMTCKVQHVCSGGVTHFAIAPSEDDPEHPDKIMTVGWGQNANNFELGYGEGQPKSSTKPQRITTLDGVDVIDIAAGQNTTFFIAVPGDTELPRHPEEVDHPETCVICSKDLGEDVLELECEKCDSPYHLQCLKIDAVPDGEWFCKKCMDEADAAETPKAADSGKGEASGSKGKKRKAIAEEEAEEAEVVEKAPRKKR
ncbi:hypothetical protein FRC03_001989 [Tulasnella sp. 419]|nr:hypothetical protein FRC02_002248 [Tulasnella sp. 418]KAG8969550.1 hypothetical protein FRC03_001989 [Tulasnella sp. 419]